VIAKDDFFDRLAELHFPPQFKQRYWQIMAEVIPLKDAHKLDKNTVLRHKILDTAVELINEQGVAAVSTRSITKRAGVSVGSVQRMFGSKSAMLEAIHEHNVNVLLEMLYNDELLQGTLDERVSMYVAMCWRHYQSDLCLAALETLMATRRFRDLDSLTRLTEQQGVFFQKRIREIFPECQQDQRGLTLLLVHTHCALTGLTLETILKPTLVNIGGFLRQISDTMLAMIQK
jgi:AcrR family transcriptional regulator